MPTTPAERRPTLALLSPLVALTLLVGGCAGGQAPPAAPSTAGGPSGAVGEASDSPSLPVPTPDLEGEPPIVEGLPVPPDLDAAFTDLLDARARALLERDREAFLAVLDQDDDGFLVAQAGYYDNLAQLPLATFSYAIDPSSLVRGATGYSVVVEIAMQLDGFDALASRTLDRFRFDRVGKPAGGRYLLASVTDRVWEETHRVQSQPWESRPVQVRRAPGVLAIFDDTSVSLARPVLRGLTRSLTDVSARVPYAWDPSVVVYALSDTTFIRSLDDLPGDEPDALDAITFTVPAGPGDPRVAATRIALNPRVLTEADRARQRLLRHELTHVALGERDDHAPIWLSEGLAEWVSVQALPERLRQVDDDALAALRRGVEAMPEDATFNDDDAAAHYALSWWVCEYLAAIYGTSAPWSVLDAFATPGTPEGPTIQALLQVSPAKLAKRGAALLAKTYAPPRKPQRGS